MKNRIAIVALIVIVAALGVIFVLGKWALSPSTDAGELQKTQAYRKAESAKHHKATIVRTTRAIHEGDLFSSENIQESQIDPPAPETSIWSASDALGKQAAYSIDEGVTVLKAHIYVPKNQRATGN